MEIVGYTIGNDMSSRDIEGENPLYLPQAKIYTRSCALGPRLVLGPARDMAASTPFASASSATAQSRGGDEEHDGTHSSQRRAELVEYLGRCLAFPDGAVLLTGTGIVPPRALPWPQATVIRITIDGVGELTQPRVAPSVDPEEDAL